MGADLVNQGMTAAGGAAVSVVSAGWFAKYLINKFIRDNDKKHEETAKALKGVESVLADIGTKLAVLSTVLGEVVALRSQIATDHDKVVRLETWNEKYGHDLTAQFGKIRDIEKDFEDLSQVISCLRREATNGKG